MGEAESPQLPTLETLLIRSGSAFADPVRLLRERQLLVRLRGRQKSRSTPLLVTCLWTASCNKTVCPLNCVVDAGARGS